MKMSSYKTLSTQIEYKGYKFLIADMPSEGTMRQYIKELKHHNVTALVRVCRAAYDLKEIQKKCIDVHNLIFDDGGNPPKLIMKQWFQLVKRHHKLSPENCVAVHCVSGLGRAPVMVALALIELGMDNEDAIELIRKKKKGAFNSKQLVFLEKYKSKRYLKKINIGDCALM